MLIACLFHPFALLKPYLFVSSVEPPTIYDIVSHLAIVIQPTDHWVSSANTHASSRSSHLHRILTEIRNWSRPYFDTVVSCRTVSTSARSRRIIRRSDPADRISFSPLDHRSHVPSTLGLCSILSVLSNSDRFPLAPSRSRISTIRHHTKPSRLLRSDAPRSLASSDFDIPDIPARHLRSLPSLPPVIAPHLFLPAEHSRYTGRRPSLYCLGFGAPTVYLLYHCRTSTTDQLRLLPETPMSKIIMDDDLGGIKALVLDGTLEHKHRRMDGRNLLEDFIGNQYGGWIWTIMRQGPFDVTRISNELKRWIISGLYLRHPERMTSILREVSGETDRNEHTGSR